MYNSPLVLAMLALQPNDQADVKVFPYSFSDAISIFFNRLKSIFFPCPIKFVLNKFSPVIGYGLKFGKNVVLSKIDVTMTTINKKL